MFTRNSLLSDSSQVKKTNRKPREVMEKHVALLLRGLMAEASFWNYHQQAAKSMLNASEWTTCLLQTSVSSRIVNASGSFFNFWLPTYVGIIMLKCFPPWSLPKVLLHTLFCGALVICPPRWILPTSLSHHALHTILTKGDDLLCVLIVWVSGKGNCIVLLNHEPGSPGVVCVDARADAVRLEVDLLAFLEGRRTDL